MFAFIEEIENLVSNHKDTPKNIKKISRKFKKKAFEHILKRKKTNTRCSYMLTFLEVASIKISDSYH